MKKTVLRPLILTLFLLYFSNLTHVYAQTSSLRFVAWGDTKGDTGALTKLSPQIKSLNPVFTIYAGDLVSDGFDTTLMAAYKTALNGGSANNGLSNITFPVRGNHDDHLAGAAANWQNYFNIGAMVPSIGGSNYSALSDDLTYSFDYGNSRFIGIDVVGDVTLMTSAQITWLDQRLTDAESRSLTHAFIYWHGPIYAVAEHCCPTAPSALITVLNKHPIVSATFHGHEHVLTYVHMNSSRIPAITHQFEEFVTGDAGAGPNTNVAGRYDYWLQVPNNEAGFVVIDVSGTSYTASFYKGGTITAQWTKTFSKGSPQPSATPGGPTPTASLSPTVTPTPNPTCPSGSLGNLNCDGGELINETDLSIFLNKWAPLGPVPTPGLNQYSTDLNGDRKVDEIDLARLLSNWRVQ